MLCQNKYGDPCFLIFIFLIYITWLTTGRSLINFVILLFKWNHRKLLFVFVFFHFIFLLLLMLYYFYRQVSLPSLWPYHWVSRQEKMGSRLLSAMNSKNSSKLQISFRVFTYVKTNELPFCFCSRKRPSDTKISLIT